MALAPEKRRKNTAAKQLPSWLHPAVPTIRSYPKTAHQFKGVYPPSVFCASVQFSGDSNNHRCTAPFIEFFCIIHANAAKINQE